MRIVFMGTPDFAVPSLEILLTNGYEIVGVITSTDKLGGRGKKQLLQSAVKKYALANGLKVLQPKNLKSPEFLFELKELKADVQVVVAFRMLPEVVWDMPHMGTYNLHGSLLPRYRGAAPINWAIIRGEEYTGLTTFKLKHEIDTGDLAFQSKLSISRIDTAGSLHDKMMGMGAELILKTIKSIENGSVPSFAQDETLVSKAPKIYHKDCLIDFNDNVFAVYNYIRGLSPYPTAWTHLLDKKLKIFSCSYSYQHHAHTPGTFLCNGRDILQVAAKDGLLTLNEIQLEGKRKMDINNFLNGMNITRSNSPSPIQS